MKNNQPLPSAVILDITYSGYGALRSLHPYGITLIGFTFDPNHAETKTSLTKEVYIYSLEKNDLLEKLMECAGKCDQKPVLILTNDDKVEFVLDHLDAIKAHFHINLPAKITTEMLIDKIKLQPFIQQHHIKTPKSLTIESYQDIDGITALQFPVILKPYVKSQKWNGADLPKAFIFNSRDELMNMFPTLFNTENRLIVQEFIPGGDSDIFYCLVYYGADGQCKASFTGQKIRQWNILKGSTASTRGIDEPFIEEETKRIFDLADFRGFGSIEYKRHPKTGEYYMIEPTAGRLNLQEYIATFSGVNLPLIAYCDHTGITIKGREKQRKNAVFINEIFELESANAYHHLYGLTLKEWYKSVHGKKCYRYFNLVDRPVVIKMGVFITKKLIGILLRNALGRKPKEPAERVDY